MELNGVDRFANCKTAADIYAQVLHLTLEFGEGQWLGFMQFLPSTGQMIFSQQLNSPYFLSLGKAIAVQARPGWDPALDFDLASALEEIFDGRVEIYSWSSNGQILGCVVSPSILPKYFLQNLIDLANVFIERLALRTQSHSQIKVDVETGLWRRDFFIDRLDAEISRAHRFSQDLAVAIVYAPNCLEKVSEFLQKYSRPYDWLARWTKNEIAVCLPSTDVIGAAVKMERLRVWSRSKLAIGISHFPKPASDRIELLEFADRALKQALIDNSTCIYKSQPLKAQNFEGLNFAE